MNVKLVLYQDPLGAQCTLVVGWVVERVDHLLIITEMVGQNVNLDGAEATEAFVIPKSQVLAVEDIDTRPKLRVLKGGKDGGDVDPSH